MGLSGRNTLAPVVLGCLILFATVALEAQEIRFHPGDSLNPGNGSVEVTGLQTQSLIRWQKQPPDWKTILKVFPKTLRLEKKDAVSPMLGTYSFRENRLLFRPRFPFREGGEYIVEFSEASNGFPLIAYFAVPQSPPTPPVFVEAVYPGAAVVPANMLKMYVYFSAPMGPGNVYEHIRLVDETGAEVPKPFLELEPGLWDKSRKRLTLWFDPGRIKTDLQPNLSMGQPLQAGKCYKLLISKSLADAFKQPMAQDFEKNFCAGPEDRTKPEPATWQVMLPGAATTDALVIRFPENLDKATLESGVSVVDANDQVVAGKVLVLKSETEWTFMPELPWQAGTYQLVLNPRLEDLAGNNLMRLFDTPVEAGTPEVPVKEDFGLQFWIVD